MKQQEKQYLYDMFNATSTDDGNGDIETYENWLERQLLSRVKKSHDRTQNFKGLNLSSNDFYLKILRNIRREMSKAKSKRTYNFAIVRDFILVHTQFAGMTSCCEFCDWIGVDPYGREFKLISPEKKKLTMNKSATNRSISKIEITDIDDFQDIINDRLDEFLKSFTEKEGLIIKLSDDELEDYDLPDGCNMIYHPRGCLLYERMQERFYKLGKYYFGDEVDDIELKSSYISDI